MNIRFTGECLSQKASNIEPWYFLCCTPELAAEQIVEFPRLNTLCHPCDVTIIHAYAASLELYDAVKLFSINTSNGQVNNFGVSMLIHASENWVINELGYRLFTQTITITNINIKSITTLGITLDLNRVVTFCVHRYQGLVGINIGTVYLRAWSSFDWITHVILHYVSRYSKFVSLRWQWYNIAYIVGIPVIIAHFGWRTDKYSIHNVNATYHLNPRGLVKPCITRNTIKWQWVDDIVYFCGEYTNIPFNIQTAVLCCVKLSALSGFICGCTTVFCKAYIWSNILRPNHHKNNNSRV